MNMNTNTALIPLTEGAIQGHRQPLCDARDLHAFLEVRRDFNTWIKQRIAKYGFVENQDFVCVEGLALSPNLANQSISDLCSPNLGNQSSIENVLATEPSLNVRSSAGRGGDRRSIAYHISLDMAKELAMVENNERGRQARRYFIKCERIATDNREHKTELRDPFAEDFQPISLLIPPQADITCVMPDKRVYAFVWSNRTRNHEVVVGASRVLDDFIRGPRSPVPTPILFATPLWFDLLGRRAMAITGDVYEADGGIPHEMFPAAQGLIIGTDKEIIALCNDKGYSVDSYLVPHNSKES